MQDCIEALQNGSKPRYKVRGIRDGILISFDLGMEADLSKRNAYVLAQTQEAAMRFSDLLGAYSVIALSGTTLGEPERIALEKTLSTALGRDIHIRLRDSVERQEKNSSKTHIGTVRSGMLLQSDGDLTVVGDVHVGARLEAGGSIFVFGVLSGSARAGIGEKKDAIVCAWQLDAAEICIADKVWRKTGSVRREKAYPEYAYADTDGIKINKYNHRK